MATLRLPLHVALAFALASLTCGIGAACAAMGERCCCMTEDGSSPCTEMSDRDDAPVSPAPVSALESGERFSVAIVTASPLAASSSVSASISCLPDTQAAPGASTPLYLSHCAFLC